MLPMACSHSGATVRRHVNAEPVNDGGNGRDNGAIDRRIVANAGAVTPSEDAGIAAVA